MAYSNHRFCWHGIVSTDPTKATAFYTEVLPWTAMKMPMGDDEITLLAAAEIPRAHVMAPPDDVPGHWINYLRVEDVDASNESALANGGSQFVEPNDIPPGRFSVLASPSGAALAIFHEADPNQENAPPGEGSIVWTELHSQDVEADLSWLKATFGFAVEGLPMPDGGTYHMLKVGDDTAGGVCPAMSPEAPSMFLSWVHVPNVDEAVARIKRLGGKAFAEPSDWPNVGRMALVADSTGGVFGVITPIEG